MLVLAPLAVVEVAAIGCVELVESIEDVGRGVAVDQVEDDNDAQRVGDVDEQLQLVRGPVPTARPRQRCSCS